MKTVSLASKKITVLSCAMLALFAVAPVSAQPAAPVFSPGASVAGHWTGKAVPVPAQADYQAPWNLDLKLSQDGNTVTGTFAMINSDNVPGKAYELHGMIQGGRVGLTAEISTVEHPHFRMTLVNGTLVGEVWNFHDEPNRWPFDSDRTFALKKIP